MQQRKRLAQWRQDGPTWNDGVISETYKRRHGHVGLVQEYHRAVFLKEYYLWQAIKGFEPAGNVIRPTPNIRQERQQLGRAMHKAAYRYYLDLAQVLRNQWGQVLP